MDSIPQPIPDFSTILRDMADRAHEVLAPEFMPLIPKALEIALAGRVLITSNDSADVGSSDGSTAYHVNDSCTCPYVQRGHASLCKHRLAFWLVKRAQEELALLTAEAGQAPQQNIGEPLSPAQTIFHDNEIVHIQGKPFVRYAGLLRVAHEQGLVSLSAVWTYNDDSVSLAQATATFDEGATFTECGDATPSNVTAQCAKHFRRIALTRAKARALRDALGVDLVAVEEMAE